MTGDRDIPQDASPPPAHEYRLELSRLAENPNPRLLLSTAYNYLLDAHSSGDSAKGHTGQEYVSALCKLAQGAKQIGENPNVYLEKAVAIAHGLLPENRKYAATDIAEAYASLGEIKKAIAIRDRKDQHSQKTGDGNVNTGEINYAIAKHYVSTHKIEEAIAVITDALSPAIHDKVAYLFSLIEETADEAKKEVIIKRVKDVIRKYVPKGSDPDLIVGYYNRAVTFIREPSPLAQEFLHDGLEEIQEDTSFYYAQQLVNFGKKCAEIGSVEDALKIKKMIRTSTMPPLTYGEHEKEAWYLRMERDIDIAILKRYAASDEKGEAWNIFRVYEHDKDWTEGEKNAAEALILIAEGKHDEALRLLPDINDVFEKMKLLRSIVIPMAQTESQEKIAQAVTENMDDAIHTSDGRLQLTIDVFLAANKPHDAIRILDNLTPQSTIEAGVFARELQKIALFVYNQQAQSKTPETN